MKDDENERDPRNEADPTQTGEEMKSQRLVSSFTPSQLRVDSKLTPSVSCVANHGGDSAVTTAQVIWNHNLWEST